MNPTRRGPTARLRLYADRPECPTRHHNTVGAYRMGCHCPEAVEAQRLARKRQRQGRAQPRQVDAAGTVRRIRALMLAGHRAGDIARAIGSDPPTIREVSRGERKHVLVPTAEAIRVLTHRWADKPGPSTITASRARVAGYVSLAAWDDIDDPTCLPDLGCPETEGVDEVAVRRVIDGSADPATLTPAEWDAAVDIMWAAGRSRSAIATRLHVNNRTVTQRVGTSTPVAVPLVNPAQLAA